MKYISAGYVVAKDNKKGVMYFPYDEGQIDKSVETRLVFWTDKQTDYPVGCVLNIDKVDNKFNGFTLLHGETPPDEFVKEYSVKSELAEQEVKLERLRKNKTTVKKIIEAMTVKELREYAKRSSINRDAVLFYFRDCF